MYIYDNTADSGSLGHRLIGASVYMRQILKNKTESRKLPGFSSLIWDSMPFNWDKKPWKSKKGPELLQKFCADIYSADETGLFYRAMTDDSLCYEHVKLLGSKKAVDRIIVLCCSNMSGTDKRKLLVIGESAKPRCFKGLNMDSLPVKYYANKNAWMTSEIFKKWLMRWDVELQRNQEKFF
jgi:hypothetical protein